MRVESLADAATFLAVSEPLRAADPILTNLPGSIAENAVAGRRFDPELWLVVRDQGVPVGCAIRSGPFKVVLSPMPAAAARAIGAWLRGHHPDVPGFTGPDEAVRAAALGLGRGVDIRLREVARVLSELREPSPDRRAPGHPKPAERSELDLLVRWLQDFEVEVGLQRFASHEHTGAQVDSGRLWVWRVDEGPVAVAGHAPVVTTPGGTVGRIGPVYTPPEQRRRGYGSAITRAVVVQLMGSCDRVMLFADAANLDSNSIYEAMGFVVVGQIVEAELTP